MASAATGASSAGRFAGEGGEAAVWFGVLGPLEVRVGGRPVAVGGGRLARLTGGLVAAGVGRVVSVQSLVDTVWDVPPATARRQVQDLVGRLRRLLTAAGADDDVVRRRGGGYVVERGVVDLAVFEELAAQGRNLVSAGDGTGGVEVLREALALWRGEPLDGSAGVSLEGAVRGWEELRLAVWEECVRVELEAGGTAVVGELVGLVERYPYRESLVGLLMVALDRVGRRGDALEAFRKLEERLVAEFGVGAGAALRQLRAQLLAGREAPAPDVAAPDVAAPVTAPPEAAADRGGGTAEPPDGPTWHVPRELPLDVSGFSGRRRELARLDDMLTAADERPSTVVISVLSGTAGAGKTALALHWAHRVADRFPDGQLYVNLRGFDPGGQAMNPAEVLRGFLEALQVPGHRLPGTVAAQAALFRSLLADRRVLVVLDNARDSDQVRPLLPGTPGCLVVVTSRNQLSGLVANECAQPLTLDLLSAAEAHELLVRRLGEARVTAEPEAVGDIVAWCAGLPLALTIVAARAAIRPEFPIAGYAAALRAAGGRLDELVGDDDATDIRGVFSWSYRCLTPAAARLFRLLGVHPGPDATAAAAASLAGAPVRQVRALLAELASSHLLTEHVPGRYTCHDLLRVYAVEVAHSEETAADLRTAVHRIGDHYLHSADHAARLLAPHQSQLALPAATAGVTPEEFADDSAAMAWYTAELGVLLAAIQQSARLGVGARTWQLASTIIEFLDRKALWHDQAASHETALEAALRHGDAPGQAQSRRALGWAYMRLGRYDEATDHLTQAAEVYRELGDHRGEADAHRNLGWVCECQDDQRAALDHDQRALELYRAAGDRAGEARVLSNLGWDYSQLGDHERALRYCEQALGPLRETGNRRGEAATLDSLGFAHHHLGNLAEAIACFTDSVDLYRELGDTYNEADTLTHLGDSYEAAGDTANAHKTWRQALRMFVEMRHSDADQVRSRLNPE